MDHPDNKICLSLKIEDADDREFDELFCAPMLDTENSLKRTLNDGREAQKKCVLYEPHVSGWCKWCVVSKKFDSEEIWTTMCKNTEARDKAVITQAIKKL